MSFNTSQLPLNLFVQKNRILTTLIVASIYFIAAKAGLAIALPPGFATIFWPPSGIALALMTICGRCMAPGIFLGSVLANLSTVDFALNPTNIALVTLVAMGATLQAWVGSYLMHRFLNVDLIISKLKDAVGFYVLVSPLSCSISASVATMSLILFNKITPVELPINWLNWYIGDVLGVSVFTPLILFLLKSDKIFRDLFKSFLIPISFVLASVIGVYWSSNRYEQQDTFTQFEKEVTNFVGQIQDHLLLAQSEAKAASALFWASREVTSEEFAVFTEKKRLLHSSLGLAVIQRRTKTNDVSVEYLNLIENPNHYSTETVKQAIQRLNDTTVHSSVDLSTQFVSINNLPSLLILSPTSETQAIVNIIDTSALIQNALQRTGAEEFTIQISQSSDSSLLFDNSGVQPASPVTNPYFTLEKSFTLLDKQMNIKAIASVSWALKHRSWYSSLIFVAGLAFASLLNLTLIIIAERERQTLHEIDQRTKELQEAQELLVQSAKLSALGELSANIAHEVQNPLSVVSLNAERILDMESGVRQNGINIKDSALKILSTTQRLSKIVSDILAIARDSSNDPFQYISAEDLIEKVEAIANSRLRNTQTELKKNIQTHALIWCQPSQILQVLINLVNNSIDATTGLNEKWILFSCQKIGSYIEIAITDSGSKISKEIADKMMQPFFTTKPAGKGTGLGLSLVKKIVSKHKGEFFYDASSPNTRFVIRLPTS